ncbi:MAG: ParB/RepB/Spo0J family partition protein [Rhodobacteraceae bacterium]|nr:ParB/RepB/Spo0J family partition protein [Paracoccaceae bacterium]
MQLQNINLTDLTPAKLNVRKHGGKSVDDLIPSIRAHGLLQPLLVRPKEDGYEIVAGQRRYHALCALSDEQEQADPVPCLVMAEGDDAKAIEASLAENVLRLPMDAIDQFKAFAALVRNGLGVSDIADQFGITERLVRQRLAIANLIPPILTAYRKGEIGATTIQLLTMATKKQQQAWIALFKSENERAPEGYRLKCWLFGGAEITTDAALFDLADYSGSIVSDLFGEDSYFADSEAFWILQNKAIAEAKAAYLAEGWSEVILLETGQYFPSYDYVETAKEEGGKVYIQIAHSGEVTFHEGQLSRAEARAREKGRKGALKTETPELTKPMQNYLDLHRHAAVRQCLLAHHGTALRLAVAQIIAGSELWAVQADPQKASKETIGDSLATSAAQKRFGEERQAVAELLGLTLEDGETLVPRKEDWAASRDLHALFARLMALSDDEVLCILALVTAECLPAGSAMVENLGVQLEVNMQDHWQPDQAFLDLTRDKTVINAMLAEIAGEDTAAAHITSTAKTSKSIIKACLDGTSEAKDAAWHPRYMRFPMEAYTDKGGIRAIDLWAALNEQDAECV